MTDAERVDRFRADFDKLKRNRAQIPLEKLKTTYRKSYAALLASLAADADWFANRYLRVQVESWPMPPDAEERTRLVEDLTAALEHEKRPGGLREAWRAALMDELDWEKFGELVRQHYERCRKKSFDPYWRRHCRWVGPPENRRIYNDILRRFWLPPKADASWPRGAWQRLEDGTCVGGWPPGIGPDIVKAEQEGGEGP